MRASVLRKRRLLLYALRDSAKSTAIYTNTSRIAHPPGVLLAQRASKADKIIRRI
jgi:hypothetical protein